MKGPAVMRGARMMGKQSTSPMRMSARRAIPRNGDRRRETSIEGALSAPRSGLCAAPRAAPSGCGSGPHAGHRFRRAPGAALAEPFPWSRARTSKPRSSWSVVEGRPSARAVGILKGPWVSPSEGRSSARGTETNRRARGRATPPIILDRPLESFPAQGVQIR